MLRGLIAQRDRLFPLRGSNLQLTAGGEEVLGELVEVSAPIPRKRRYDTRRNHGTVRIVCVAAHRSSGAEGCAASGVSR